MLYIYTFLGIFGIARLPCSLLCLLLPSLHEYNKIQELSKCRTLHFRFLQLFVFVLIILVFRTLAIHLHFLDFTWRARLRIWYLKTGFVWENDFIILYMVWSQCANEDPENALFAFQEWKSTCSISRLSQGNVAPCYDRSIKVLPTISLAQVQIFHTTQTTTPTRQFSSDSTQVLWWTNYNDIKHFIRHCLFFIKPNTTFVYGLLIHLGCFIKHNPHKKNTKLSHKTSRRMMSYGMFDIYRRSRFFRLAQS